MGTPQAVEAAAVTPSLFLGERLTTIEHAETDDVAIAAALIMMGETVLVRDPSLALAVLLVLGAPDAEEAVSRAQHGIS